MPNSPSTIANAIFTLISLLFLIMLVILGSSLFLKKLYLEAVTIFLIAMSVYISYTSFRSSVINGAEQDDDF